LHRHRADAALRSTALAIALGAPLSLQAVRRRDLWQPGSMAMT
jgi:hypothetical protein